MCKVENVSGIPQIKYKTVTKTTSENDNWISLDLQTSRYQVISVMSLETTENNHAIIAIPYYHSSHDMWRVRLYDSSDMTKVVDTTMSVLVVYLDFGSSITGS